MPKKQEITAEIQQTGNQGIATSQPAGSKERAAVIYLGPAIAGVATPGTVYKNGLTPQIERAVAELPALKMLLVETTKAQQTRKDLRDPQSAASICYQNVLEYAEKKGVKG